MDDNNNNDEKTAWPRMRLPTPPRAIFTDYASAYTSILHQPMDEFDSSMRLLVREMEARGDPYSNPAPARLDVPGQFSSPVTSHTGKTSDGSISDSQDIDIIRSVTPLLPPIPVMTGPWKSPLTGSTVGKTHYVASPEKGLPVVGFGPDDIELKDLGPVTPINGGICQTIETRNSQSFFDLSGIALGYDQIIKQHKPNAQGTRGRVEKSNVVGKIVERPLVEVRSSAEIFGVTDKDVELCRQRSVAYGKSSSSNETTAGDPLTTTHGIDCSRNIAEAGIPLLGASGEVSVRDFPGKETEQPRNSRSDQSENDFVRDQTTNIMSLSDASASVDHQLAAHSTPDDEYILQPKRYEPPPRRRVVKKTFMPPSFGGMDPGPGCPQSSSSQTFSGGDLSFPRDPGGRTGCFKHDETLSSLAGESESVKSLDETRKEIQGKNPRLIVDYTKDKGSVNVDAEEDNADCGNMYKRGLKGKSGTRMSIARAESDSSVANLSSQGTLSKQNAVMRREVFLSKFDGIPARPAKAMIALNYLLQSDVEHGQKAVLTEGDRNSGVEHYRQHKMSTKPLPSFASTQKPRFVPKYSKFPTYQHPFPLLGGHSHPFTSSPPVIEQSPTGSLGPLDLVDENLEEIRPHTYDYCTELESRDTKHAEELPGEDGGDSTWSSIVSAVLTTESSSSEPADSLQSILCSSSTPLPRSGGTLSKTTVLGSKDNITGTPNGTGMRATGSSEANYSTDPAIMGRYHYEPVRSEDATDSKNREPALGTNDAADSSDVIMEDPLINSPTSKLDTEKALMTTRSKQGTQAKTVAYPSLATPLLEVTTPAGFCISTPVHWNIPAVLPDVNSFTLRDEDPLVHGACSDEMIMKRIEIANDDMIRLRYFHPIFPLRDEFLESYMMYQGKSIDSPRAKRGKNRESDGRFFESCYCYECKRWEFSHTPILRRNYHCQSVARQHESGRMLVLLCAGMVPVFCIGLVLLYKIAYGKSESGEMILWWSKWQVYEFSEDERKLAKKVFRAFVAGGLVLCLVLVILTIYLANTN